jgi:hypothetical protein
VSLAPGFLTLLRVEEVDADRWRLIEPLHYRSSLAGDLIVPAGFLTDFCSIPKWAPVLYAVLKGRGRKAGVVHDYLYETALYPRRLCDEVFAEALRGLGEPERIVRIFYAGVRIGGASYYRGGSDPASADRSDRVEG